MSTTTDTITVALRKETGKSASRQLRKAGLIPATIYGLSEAPVSISISPKIVARVLASDTGMNSMLHLQREGTDIKRHVIIKDVQRDPIKPIIEHVDVTRDRGRWHEYIEREEWAQPLRFSTEPEGFLLDDSGALRLASHNSFVVAPRDRFEIRLSRFAE